MKKSEDGARVGEAGGCGAAVTTATAARRATDGGGSRRGKSTRPTGATAKGNATAGEGHWRRREYALLTTLLEDLQHEIRHACVHVAS